MPWDSYRVLCPPPENKWQITFLLCAFFIPPEMQDVVCGLFSDHLVPPKISQTWLSSWHPESAKSNMILVFSRTFLPLKWSLIPSWDCTLLMSKSVGDALFKLLKYIVRDEEKMRGRDQCLWKTQSSLCFLFFEWTTVLLQGVSNQPKPKDVQRESWQGVLSSSQAAQNPLDTFWRWILVWACWFGVFFMFPWVLLLREEKEV